MGEFESKLQKGMNEFIKGNLNASIKIFWKANKINPSDIRPYISLGLAYAAAEKPEKSRDIAEKGLAIRKHPELYQIIGRAYEAQERFEDALSTFQKYAEMNDEGKMHQVRILIKTDRLDEAKKILIRIKSDNPDHITAMNNLGRLYLEAGEYSKAIEVLSMSAAKEPHSYTFEKLAHAFSCIRDHDSAVESYQKAIEAGHPDKDRMCNEMGVPKHLKKR